MEAIKVQTPEEISLAFYPAGLGSRFVSLLIDSFIQFLFFIVAALFIPLMLKEQYVGRWFALVWIGVLGFFHLGYYCLFEILWDGQTPGKKWLRMKVICDGAFPLTAKASLIRNLFRIVDDFPVVWLVPLLSRSHKRIGDYVAGTLVITLRSEKPYLPFAGQHYSNLPSRHFQFGKEDLKKFKKKDFRFLEEYHSRFLKLEPELQKTLCAKVFLAFSEKLERGVPMEEATPFLKELYLFLREERMKRLI